MVYISYQNFQICDVRLNVRDILLYIMTYFLDVMTYFLMTCHVLGHHDIHLVAMTYVWKSGDEMLIANCELRIANCECDCDCEC